jgi:hypothetical protein
MRMSVRHKEQHLLQMLLISAPGYFPEKVFINLGHASD